VISAYVADEYTGMIKLIGEFSVDELKSLVSSFQDYSVLIDGKEAEFRAAVYAVDSDDPFCFEIIMSTRPFEER
jgi:hypothetical protein